MPAALWPLHNDLPTVELTFPSLVDGQEAVCRLIADTGAGSRQSVFELILDDPIVRRHRQLTTCHCRCLGLILRAASIGSIDAYNTGMLP